MNLPAWTPRISPRRAATSWKWILPLFGTPLWTPSPTGCWPCAPRSRLDGGDSCGLTAGLGDVGVRTSRFNVGVVPRDLRLRSPFGRRSRLSGSYEHRFPANDLLSRRSPCHMQIISDVDRIRRRAASSVCGCTVLPNLFPSMWTKNFRVVAKLSVLGVFAPCQCKSLCGLAGSPLTCLDFI